MTDNTISLPGDAFTEKEIEAALDPLQTKFEPSREYPKRDIGSLVPGPQAVTFVGRIVNFNTHFGRSKCQTAATGWHYLIVKDDTGAICVKLYFIHKPYDLKLGLLLTIWTPHVGTITSANPFPIPGAPNTTSIFPGRESSVHIIIHKKSDIGDTCSVPLNYNLSQPLVGQMALKSFISGGNEIHDTKLLVCVKRIEARKSITNKKGVAIALTEVIVFDETAEITFKLWGDMGLSVRNWMPNTTILLLSNPTFRNELRGRCSIGLSHATMVDIEPQFADADWLRKYAASLKKSESLNQEFPQDVWKVGLAMDEADRILYNLADIDEQVRADPHDVFTGYLSVIIMEMSLVLYFRRNMLMCSQCCGVAIYANATTFKCKSCEIQVKLHLNPKVIGTLIDETGSIAPGRLLWSPQAWEDLFGRPAAQLLTGDVSIIQMMEQRMIYMRVHLKFGWAEDVGKLAILAVHM